MSFSVPSMPKAMAGRESVIRFIHSSCMEMKGARRQIIIAKNTTIISLMLVPSKKPTTFFMLSYMPLPSLTASTMVAKLSSVKVISAALLATSVPVIPIAQPISAAFKAGASFTPSPVMDTTLPFFCHAFTMRILFSGETRAYTAICSTCSSSSSSLILSSSAPVIALSPSCNMPSWAAMADAVTTWSPVIITGFIPACLHTATASLTSSLGGSIMPTSPRKVKPLSTPSEVSSCGISSTCLYAKASTRSALELISSFTLRATAVSPLTQRFSNSSNAPFTMTKCLPSILFIVVISLRTESNGSSSSRG